MTRKLSDRTVRWLEWFLGTVALVSLATILGMALAILLTWRR